MEHSISRSEKKRRAKGIVDLTKELVDLPPGQIRALPLDDFLKEEIASVADMKAGSRKRQIKYITKHLRSLDCDPLYDFLEERKGSKLKEKRTFHELERLRDEIVSAAIQDQREANLKEERLDSSWQNEAVDIAMEQCPNMDQVAIKTAAIKYAITRKPAFQREIFRLLKAAQEQLKYE